MSRIDRIRRAAQVGKVVRAENGARDDAGEPHPPRLPVVVPASPVRQPSPVGADADAAFAAQLMGQEGQKRGLRAGPLHIEAARGAYNKVEWSGSKDRRARAGRKARTEV